MKLAFLDDMYCDLDKPITVEGEEVFEEVYMPEEVNAEIDRLTDRIAELEKINANLRTSATILADKLDKSDFRIAELEGLLDWRCGECVHCGKRDIPIVSRDHWLECPSHPANVRIAELEAELESWRGGDAVSRIEHDRLTAELALAKKALRLAAGALSTYGNYTVYDNLLAAAAIDSEKDGGE
jgi:hypothetical protein